MPGSDRGGALNVLGLMSGTSADGVDAALLEVPAQPGVDALRSARHVHVPYSEEQRRAIFALFDTERTTAADVCAMNFRLGEWFAAAALAAMDQLGAPAGGVDLIGSHGQTILHCPPQAAPAGGPAPGRTACTLQIGEPAVIAERTGITTVGDFRVRDVAAGGHGAPLVSYVDGLLFGDADRTRAVLNLGGIANATVIPARRLATAPVVAFDTGPANMVMDWLAGAVTGQAFDAGGRLAAAGTVDETLLAELLAHPYFQLPPPKTTGREDFGAAYARAFWQRAQQRGLGPADALATAAALTAETVAGALRLAAPAAAPVEEVIAGGGGTRNPTLMAALARRLPGVRVVDHEAFGVSSQAKEAVSFAILAAACVRGQPNTLPSCTGARQPVVMGKILPGDNFQGLMRRLFVP